LQQRKTGEGAKRRAPDNHKSGRPRLQQISPVEITRKRYG
jgi:hypothetical protein